MLMLFSGWNENGQDGMRMGMQRSTGVRYVPDSELIKGLYSTYQVLIGQSFPNLCWPCYIPLKYIHTF